MKRKIDNLGRITLMKRYRDELNLKEGEEVEVDYKDNQIIITNPKMKSSRSREEIEAKIEELKESPSFGYVDNLGNLKSVNDEIVNALKWAIYED